MALTRAKRGRSPKKTEGKSTRKNRDTESKVQQNVSKSSTKKEAGSKTGLETGEETELFVQKSHRTAAARKRSMVVKAPETSGEGDVELEDTRTDEQDDDSDASIDSFPQFVIDSKPDFRLNVDNGDSENDENDSEFEFPSSFVIDKVGSSSKTRHGQIKINVKESDSENVERGGNSSLSKKSNENKVSKQKLSQEKKSLPSLAAPCEIDVGMDLGDCYINLDGEDAMSSKTAVENILLKSQKDELIKKSVLTPDFEKKHSIPPYKIGMRQLKKQRKQERESTKGDGWFNMKAPEMTEELRNDIKVIRMRSTLDPKRFYKSNDMAAIPKFVQIGTVVDNPVDFYHSRVPKKQRKQTLVDELLADSDTRRYNKRKYMELQERFNSIPKGQKKRNYGRNMDYGKKKMDARKR
eukprot:XP_791185.2 PREDICTED: deoxynucleotidyltransferase terminal-interacting protein 2 [Strongylocentrotus purpuratus]